MASPNSTYGDIFTTTIENRSRKLADNVTENNMLLKRLKERGNVRTVSGGEKILQELDYAENGNFTYYSGYEVLPIAPQNTFTAAEFDWKQAAVAVTCSGLETDVQNTGKERFIDLMASRIKNAERTMMNNLSAGVYSDGTGFGGKQIGGLQLLVADDPTTGTVGNIDRSVYTFWRNQVVDASDETGGAVTASNIQGLMNKLYLETHRNTDDVDLIVADDNYYTAYWESLQTIQRITTESSADAGYANLKYKGADVIADGGQGGSCPTDHMYFLNTDYIHYRPAAGRNMKVSKDRYSTNQDAMVRFFLWAGNMTLSNASLQGVIIA